MALRGNLQNTATRLIDKFGDAVNIVTVTITPGANTYSPPITTTSLTPVNAVVTGAGKWADGETIIMTDLVVLVSGASVLADVGGIIQINSKPHTIVARTDILATGIKSAVRYFVRG